MYDLPSLNTHSSVFYLIRGQASHKPRIHYSGCTAMVCFYSGATKRPFLLGFPDSSVGKESACNAGDPSLICGSGRSTGERIGYLLQYSWASLVAQLVKNPPAMWETWVLSLCWEDPLEKGTATQPTPVFWPGEFHGLYSPWGRKESDMTE